MKVRRSVRFVAALVIAAGLSALVLAQTPNMNVKLGLWEMTMSLDMGPAGGIDTSKMPPEQRAQVEAMMKGRGMAPMVIKNCMTKEKLAEQKFTTDRPGQTCTQKVTKATATTLDMVQTCTGDQPMTSEIHIEMVTPASMKMVAKQIGGRGPATVTMTGKWISENCGEVK